MFDFHIHTAVSYDGHNSPLEMAEAAKAAGLREICFTDHLDYQLCRPRDETAYRVEDYNAAHDNVAVSGLSIRHGAEVGMTPWNREEIEKDLSARHYDFVIGSVHFVEDEDPYLPPYWQGKTVDQAESAFFEENLKCIQLHDNFDVLGHLTYISKVRAHPARRPVELNRYREITAEILKALIAKGKGLEINTSGIDRIGDFLPGADYLRLYRDLGGEIVTIGSDAHSVDRVGQYAGEALTLVKEMFGCVCTFQNRQPVFHKLLKFHHYPQGVVVLFSKNGYMLTLWVKMRIIYLIKWISMAGNHYGY